MVHGVAALGGAIVGFVAATGPHVIQMLKDRWAHQRYLELKNAELEAQKQTFEQLVASQNATIAAQVQALATASQATAAPAPVPTPCDDDEVKGHPVMQFLRSSVRPLVTYGFFIVFAAVKLFALRYALHNHLPFADTLDAVWDEDTESLFAAVITFWFGSRAVNASSSTKGKDDGNTDKPVEQK